MGLEISLQAAELIKKKRIPMKGPSLFSIMNRDSGLITFSGSGLKGGVVPSSSVVSGSAVRQEQDGGSRANRS